MQLLVDLCLIFSSKAVTFLFFACFLSDKTSLAGFPIWIFYNPKIEMGALPR